MIVDGWRWRSRSDEKNCVFALQFVLFGMIFMLLFVNFLVDEAVHGNSSKDINFERKLQDLFEDDGFISALKEAFKSVDVEHARLISYDGFSEAISRTWKSAIKSLGLDLNVDLSRHRVSEICKGSLPSELELFSFFL